MHAPGASASPGPITGVHLPYPAIVTATLSYGKARDLIFKIDYRVGVIGYGGPILNTTEVGKSGILMFEVYVTLC